MKAYRTVFTLILFWAVGTAVALEAVWPGRDWQQAQPEQVGMDPEPLARARDYALTGGGAGLIIRYGRQVMRWGPQDRRYDLKSSTKAIGVTAVALALADGKFKDLNEPALRYHPGLAVPPESNRSTGRIERITLLHLATQTAGFDKPGGYTKLLFEPGTKWAYSDGGPNWLAECLTLAYRRDLRDLLFERVFGPIGIGPDDLTWRNNAYRDHRINGVPRREFGSGISADVDAMARIGYLYLRRGRWKDRQLIPADFADMVGRVPRQVRSLPVLRPETYFNASDHYGLLWWNNADGSIKDAPTDAYWSWGLYDSLIVVIPSLHIVAARAGRSLNPERNASYAAIAPFIGPIASSVSARPTRQGGGAAPYPPSDLRLEWAGPDTVIRRAKGSDNWPLTWADDGNIYAAYGDGWGFEPRVPTKLSLGICRIEGGPSDFRGFNILSPTGQRIGQGAAGAKASGMLCVDSVLYMLVRNLGNCQLAFSADHGATWKWCKWKFRTSFGAATFLNFGKDYAGARDRYIYIYSHDSDSAYKPADRMVLARVRRSRILDRAAYEFFAGLDAAGKGRWSSDIKARAAVFENPGRCYRSAVTYNRGLKRYFWTQSLYAGRDLRFGGGLGIFEAPEPWGPWRTVFYAEEWDIAPGESCSIPAKWISPDGRTIHLVFSGQDCFSVRRGLLTRCSPPDTMR